MMFRKLPDGQAAKRLVTISLDGQLIEAEESETIAAVLLRVPPFFNRTTPVGGKRRAPFCMMGACFDCLVEINGETTRSCLLLATEGMAVYRQDGQPKSLLAATL